jgi:hypothetical protein
MEGRLWLSQQKPAMMSLSLIGSLLQQSVLESASELPSGLHNRAAGVAAAAVLLAAGVLECTTNRWICDSEEDMVTFVIKK